VCVCVCVPVGPCVCRTQVSRKKMLLEHLVVRKMGAAGDLKQSELDDILRYGAQVGCLSGGIHHEFGIKALAQPASMVGQRAHGAACAASYQLEEGRSARDAGAGVGGTVVAAC
jgi:hypothetical protein